VARHFNTTILECVTILRCTPHFMITRNMLFTSPRSRSANRLVFCYILECGIIVTGFFFTPMICVQMQSASAQRDLLAISCAYAD
jgi:hypothetical protein